MVIILAFDSNKPRLSFCRVLGLTIPIPIPIPDPNPQPIPKECQINTQCAG